MQRVRITIRDGRGVILADWKFRCAGPAYEHIIGRSGDLRIPRHVVDVSRAHLAVGYSRGGGFKVEVLPTLNGTFHNGVRLEPAVFPLVRNVTLVLGRPCRAAHSAVFDMTRVRYVSEVKAHLDDCHMKTAEAVVMCLARTTTLLPHVPTEMTEKLLYFVFGAFAHDE